MQHNERNLNKHLCLDSDTIISRNFLFLLAVFIAGGVIGIFLSRYFSNNLGWDIFMLDEFENQGFGTLFWNHAKYQVFLLLLSTSFLGVFLIPATIFIRGYILGCISTLIVVTGYHNLIIIKYAVIAVITIPALLIIACDTLKLSCNLLNSRHFLRNKTNFFKHNVICFSMLAVAAAIEAFFLPVLSGISI